MDRTVTVTGHGSASAIPDSAVVRVAAVHRAPNVADAFAGVSSAVEVITTEARKHTEERHIASRDLNLWPAHDHQGRQSGFEARHTVVIGCSDLLTAGALIERLVEAVGNRLQIEGVTLQVADPAPTVTEAREAAYADALARATHLAGLAGAALGPIVTLREGGRRGVPFEEMAIAASKSDASFAPGESAITAALTVTWQLEL